MRVDLTSYRCPLALVQAKLSIRDWPRQSPLELLLAEASSLADLCRWLDSQGLPHEQERQGAFFQLRLMPLQPDSADLPPAKEML
ncbi:sulfurtransferase TusA family protein [Gallaecimonas kandeliae]|uniref:sulfurtransferase TusA family protein n=1 Tax=Gallaecimonas kandeliae TaxID=3029055 RepID=UPI0026488380|nr:sulfurtransferase TusA family protein [Gallaecimonas kandeliae]WKE66884.1 sulfurtransferase TusA family protein [Gallaecimonas kandeliae]